MKQIYMSVLLVMLFTVNVFGEQHASKFGEKEKVAVVYENNVFLKAEPRNSVDDALGCPPNTVLSGAFSSDADYMGQQSSDMGRADGATKFYRWLPRQRGLPQRIRCLGQIHRSECKRI
mgnify:CR=1 FL=1